MEIWLHAACCKLHCVLCTEQPCYIHGASCNYSVCCTCTEQACSIHVPYYMHVANYRVTSTVCSLCWIHVAYNVCPILYRALHARFHSVACSCQFLETYKLLVYITSGFQLVVACPIYCIHLWSWNCIRWPDSLVSDNPMQPCGVWSPGSEHHGTVYAHWVQLTNHNNHDILCGCHDSYFETQVLNSNDLVTPKQDTEWLNESGNKTNCLPTC